VGVWKKITGSDHVGKNLPFALEKTAVVQDHVAGRLILPAGHVKCFSHLSCPSIARFVSSILFIADNAVIIGCS
jgi:hypothetical protein